MKQNTYRQIRSLSISICGLALMGLFAVFFMQSINQGDNPLIASLKPDLNQALLGSIILGAGTLVFVTVSINFLLYRTYQKEISLEKKSVEQSKTVSLKINQKDRIGSLSKSLNEALTSLQGKIERKTSFEIS